MSHASGNSVYGRLVDQLNRYPQGAPPSKTLYKILSILFSEREARLVAELPIKPFTAKTAGDIWHTSEADAQATLDTLASKAILIDGDHRGVKQYFLPPPMAGFFEFAFMRVRQDIDQKLLAELLHQYLNVEEDFIKDLFLGSETRLGRVFVQESLVTPQNAIHVLDYERASHYIRDAAHIGVSMCYCRHKMEHLEQSCQAPMNICLTFDGTAASLIRHGHARRADAREGLELLEQAHASNLVQCGENVRERVSFICNCCGCCCEAMLAAKKFGILVPVHTTNFIPQVTEECSGCGRCVDACPICAIKICPNAAAVGGKDEASVDEGICLGCGVCVRNCPHGALLLKRRAQRVITPVNSVHRVVQMAIEKGRLADLVFDNQAFASHRAMAAVLSAVLRMPPLKQALAAKQFKSLYLERLIKAVTSRENLLPTRHVAEEKTPT